MILPAESIRRFLSPSLSRGAAGLLVLIACCLAGFAFRSGPAQADGPTNAEKLGSAATRLDDQSFAQTIQPFLDTHCLNCHDDTLKRGDVDLSGLDPSAMAQDAALWRLVHEQVAHRTMPPPDRKQPTEEQRLAVSGWIDEQLSAAFAGLPQRGGPALTRRLTGKEFDRSVRDLTGIDEHFSAQFPADGGGGEGFTNNASTLFMSPLLMSKVLDASGEIAGQAQVSWARGIQFGKAGADGGNNESFSTLYQQHLDKRGVFKDDVEQLQHHLALLWQYEQAKRRDRSLTPAKFADENQADPVFLDRLYQMMRVSRAPRGAAKSVVDYYRAWGQTRRIRTAQGEEEASLAEVRKIATQCSDLVKQNPADFKATFTSSQAKRKLIDQGDTKALDELIFFVPEQAVLDALAGDERRRFEGLWIASRVESGDREAKRDAEKFVGQMLADFAAKAWRRPVDDSERLDFVREYQEHVKAERTLEQAVRIMIRGVIISPHFLFRFEAQPRPGQQVDVEPYEMASRLSYFFWGSMPDQELLDLAAADRLQDEAVLRQQVERMLQDDRSRALADSFFGEWIGFVDLLTRDGPDAVRFPQWTPEIAQAMVEQAQQSMAYMIEEDRPYTDLIEADYLFVNGQLARFLKIPGVHGEGWQRVSGVKQSRFGVAGLPAVHVMTSLPNRTSPVRRGDWLLATLLGTPTPPPPPNVGELEEEAAASSAASLREQLEAHRARPACASCHNRIDHLGFPLERFDALGRARAGKLDLRGELPDGTVFSGPEGLRDVLLARRDQLQRQLVVKTLGYALGRKIRLEDEPVVQRIELALEEDPKLSVLFTEVVLSPSFRTKSNETR